jgi:hypothetical protein
MLTCHERYKIALFCGLSPPLDKSRTVVTVRDICGDTWGKGVQQKNGVSLRHVLEMIELFDNEN